MSVTHDDRKIPLEAVHNFRDLGGYASAIVSAAISNAVFDAIGVRLRSVPFSPQKTLAALKS